MNGTPNKLAEIFRTTFDLPPDAEVVNLRQVSVAKWDSLAHVCLVSALENEFGTTIDAADALRITSFAAAQRLLHERGL